VATWALSAGSQTTWTASLTPSHRRPWTPPAHHHHTNRCPTHRPLRWAMSWTLMLERQQTSTKVEAVAATTTPAIVQCRVQNHHHITHLSFCGTTAIGSFKLHHTTTHPLCHHSLCCYPSFCRSFLDLLWCSIGWINEVTLSYFIYIFIPRLRRGLHPIQSHCRRTFHGLWLSSLAGGADQEWVPH